MVLAIGYGNPGRLDDGLGPVAASRLEELDLPGVTVDANYQLTVEDAASIAKHEAVVFIDATVSGPEPFYFARVVADAEPPLGFSSHAIEPPALMAVARSLFDARCQAYVLGVRGYDFDEFGERLSDGAERNLGLALRFLERVLRSGRLEQAADRSANGGGQRAR